MIALMVRTNSHDRTVAYHGLYSAPQGFRLSAFDIPF